MVEDDYDNNYYFCFLFFFVLRYEELYSSLVVDAASKSLDVMDSLISGNPLHIYNLIKRLVLYYPKIKKFFKGLRRHSGESPNNKTPLW